MVVGGANLYAQTLPLASRLYLTFIHGQFDGDTRFPTSSRRSGVRSRANRTMPMRVIRILQLRHTETRLSHDLASRDAGIPLGSALSFL